MCLFFVRIKKVWIDGKKDLMNDKDLIVFLKWIMGVYLYKILVKVNFK